MNYDKYFREMGNTIVVSGFKGFLVYRFVRRTYDTLAPLRGAALGWAIGLLATPLMKGEFKPLALLFVSILLLVNALTICGLFVILEWKMMTDAGLIKSAPKWETWHKRQEEKRGRR